MASHDPERPNIVLLTSDDQGPWALGCSGNPEISTPNLDALARSGVRFENMYCASPVCSPARASLLTGLTPSQHGVHDWIREGNVAPGAVAYLEGLPTLSADLAGAGYRCAMIGKWHLGDSARPQAGFEHWFAHASSHSSYVGAPMIRDGVLYDEPGYLTDVITADAVEFVADAALDGQPFFLNLNHMAPHHPWLGEHPDRFVQMYQDCSFASCPQEAPHPWLHKRVAPPIEQALADPRPSLMAYFASVTAMDEAIGRVIRALDDHGLRESTVVLFTSDNGFACGQHGIWGKGNGTYPLNMYEECVRVPAILSHPGRLPAGATVSELVSAYDVRPTLLGLAGLDPPGNIEGPGRNWCELLDGTASPGEYVVAFDEYGPTRMIRTEEWKLVRRWPNGPHELYDLVNDPNERENRIADRSRHNLVEHLSVELHGWFRRYSRADTDGERLPVTGRGQVGPVQRTDTPSACFR